MKYNSISRGGATREVHGNPLKKKKRQLQSRTLLETITLKTRISFPIFQQHVFQPPTRDEDSLSGRLFVCWDWHRTIEDDIERTYIYMCIFRRIDMYKYLLHTYTYLHTCFYICIDICLCVTSLSDTQIRICPAWPLPSAQRQRSQHWQHEVVRAWRSQVQPRKKPHEWIHTTLGSFHMGMCEILWWNLPSY